MKTGWRTDEAVVASRAALLGRIAAWSVRQRVFTLLLSAYGQG